MRRLSLMIFLCLLFIPSLTLADFYEEQLDRGIRNSEDYSYFLIKKSKEDPARAKQILEEALRYSPDLPAVYFELSKASFSFSPEGMYEFFDNIVKGIGAYKRNFWWSFTIAGSLFMGAIISFVVSIFIVVLLRLSRDLPLFSHDVMEQKTRILILLVLISALTGPLPLIGGILLIPGLYLKRRDRVVVYLYLLFLLVLPLVFKASTIFLSVPSSDTIKAIVYVNESKDNRYALSVLRNADDEISLFSYALALKREGYYDEAIELYNRLIAERPDPRYYNNLANCYVAKNDMETAKQLYEQAIQIKPLVSAYYNLSQVSARTLDFVKREEYFLTAQRLDRDSVSQFYAIFSLTPNRFVVDEVLSISTLWKYSMNRVNGTSTMGLSTISPSTISLIAIIFGIIFYVSNMRIKHRARRCKKCGAILCNKCARGLLWGSMCSKCYRSLVKIHEIDTKERIARIQALYKYQVKRRRILSLFSFILSGSAPIYAGETLKGLLFLWPFLFLLFSFLISRIFVIGMPQSSHIWLNWISLSLMGSIYLLSILITRRGLAKGWL